MHNFPMPRRQSDGKQALYSEQTATRFDGGTQEDKDMARQEDKDATDINKLIKQFGVQPQRFPGAFGEINTDLDLQQAMHAMKEAQEGLRRLPPELLKKYTNLDDFQRGINTGELQKDFDAHKVALRIAQEDAAYAASQAPHARAQQKAREEAERQEYEKFKHKSDTEKKQ